VAHCQAAGSAGREWADHRNVVGRVRRVGNMTGAGNVRTSAQGTD
jgi:hypothetical protein